MSNSIYFLRHAETSINPSLRIHEWALTERGIQETREVAKSEVFSGIEAIIHSSEKKAQETADILAEVIRVDLYEMPDFNELNRSDEVLSSSDYRARVRKTLTDWEHNVSGWESASSALQRFVEGVKRINIMFYSRNLLVVSHGLILTLYFSELRNLQSIAYERWTQLKFLTWGLVRDGKVLIDIV